jgi:hypothetical protein
MRAWITSRLVGCGAALLVAACDADSACDPGQREQQGACIPIAAVSDAGSADAGCGAPLKAKLGETCKADGDCNCEAPYCAIMQNAAEGYCSIKDCTLSPDDCPGGYQCFDLSIFSSELPRYCAKQ